MLEVVGDEPARAVGQDEEDHEQQPVVKEICSEKFRADVEQPVAALDEGLEILEPLGHVKKDEGDDRREESPGEEKFEALFAEGQ